MEEVSTIGLDLAKHEFQVHGGASAGAIVFSKTNFFRALPLGTTARASCVPLHRGRTTMVWQTTITGEDGRVAAIVTQTQLVISRP